MLMLINSIYSETTSNKLLIILIRSTNKKLFLLRSEWILVSTLSLLVNDMFDTNSNESTLSLMLHKIYYCTS